jgi:hypothetical protein
VLLLREVADVVVGFSLVDTEAPLHLSLANAEEARIHQLLVGAV